MNVNLSRITGSREDTLKRRDMISAWFSETYADLVHSKDFARHRISSMCNEYAKDVNKGLAGSTWHDFEMWLTSYPKRDYSKRGH